MVESAIDWDELNGPGPSVENEVQAWWSSEEDGMYYGPWKAEIIYEDVDRELWALRIHDERFHMFDEFTIRGDPYTCRAHHLRNRYRRRGDALMAWRESDGEWPEIAERQIVPPRPNHFMPDSLGASFATEREEPCTTENGVHCYHFRSSTHCCFCRGTWAHQPHVSAWCEECTTGQYRSTCPIEYVEPPKGVEPDYYLDREDVELVYAMNRLPGIKSGGGSCGHNLDHFRVWFEADYNQRGIIALSWLTSRRYSNWPVAPEDKKSTKGWEIRTTHGDMGFRFGLYLEGTIGPLAYVNASKLAQEINELVDGTYEGYNLLERTNDHERPFYRELKEVGGKVMKAISGKVMSRWQKLRQ